VSRLEELQDEVKALLKKRIDLEIQLYKKNYPDEEYPLPEVLISHNFRNDVLNKYKELGYTQDYIESIDARANWESTIAVNINGFKMGDSSHIIIDDSKWRDDTLLHELTHTSDYYNYCKRNNCLGISYMEFLDKDDYLCVYLLSEFRAFYRSAMFSAENLANRMEYETETFNRRQREAIVKQEVEAYYYHMISYAGFFCAYFDKCVGYEDTQAMLSAKDRNMVHTLIKFLYPLRNKSFVELEKYIVEFKLLLDSFVVKC